MTAEVELWCAWPSNAMNAPCSYNFGSGLANYYRKGLTCFLLNVKLFISIWRATILRQISNIFKNEQCTICFVPVVKEELLPSLYRALREDPDPVVSVHHHDLRIAVGIHRMICKANLVSLSCRINNEICEQGQHFTIHHQTNGRMRVLHG